MAIPYEYFCKTHGLIELEHGMTESREGRWCPVIRRDRVRCGRPLRPLVSGGSGTIFRGEGWTRSQSYREYHVKSDPVYDPYGDKEAKERRRSGSLQ